jgi:uncharacterized protein (DUF2147 family)
MTFPKTFALAALAAGLSATVALASPPPTGVWIDHTGRGAVEIVDCGGALCGHVVWVKDARNKSACRTQIIGNARPVSTNTWDRGWILDPDDNSKYSVELKTIGQDRLRVVGYMGTKLFSETFTWKRAPADLKRCDGRESVVPVAAPPAAPPVATPDVSPSPTPDIAPPAPVLQREASAAPVPPPEVVTRTQPEDAAPEPRTERRAEPRAKRKPASRQCSLDLPYITLKYPCDAF